MITFEDNIKLIYYVIYRFFKLRKDQEDLFQIGAIGLMKALKYYKEEKSKFSTFAIKCIQREIIKELYKENKRIKTLSLNSLVRNLNDNDIELIELIEDNETLTILDNIFKSQYISKKVQEILKFLKRKDLDICQELMRGLNQTQIAKKYKVTRQYINIKMNQIRKIFKTRNFSLNLFDL